MSRFFLFLTYSFQTNMARYRPFITDVKI